MSHWTKGALGLFLLLQAAQLQAQQTITKKDWDLIQTYSDFFKILNDQKTCSGFYGGSRVATTVLHDLYSHVKAQPLPREISFQMVGRTRLLRDKATGVRYRLFDSAMVNTNVSVQARE